MIRNLSLVSPVLPDAGVLTIYTVCAAEGGTAILTSLRDAYDLVDVISIARLQAGLGPAAKWLRAEIPDFLSLDRKTQVMVDAAGLGQSLFDHLQVAHRRSWVLFSKRGRDRQELVNALLVAEQEKRIRIRPSPHADAMRKALLSYHRVIGEDGVIGGEMVIALALAVAGRRRMGSPRIW